MLSFWSKKILDLHAALPAPAEFWRHTSTLNPSQHTYPQKFTFIHFPTNETNFNRLYFKNKLCPLENLTWLNAAEKGLAVSVGPELGIYYGEKFQTAGLFNIDINPSLSFLWFPFLLFVSQFSPGQTRKLIENFYAYASAWNIINAPTQSIEHKNLQDSAKKKLAKIDPAITHFIEDICPPANKAYLKYFRSFMPGIKKEAAQWPIFSNKNYFPFLKKLREQNQLWFIQGSIVESSAYNLLNQCSEKIKLIYFSNILDYLSSKEKHFLKGQLLGLAYTNNCLAIVSSISASYLYRLEDFLNLL